MLLSEIINEIDTRLPNTFTATQKVAWINSVLRRYYKYAPLVRELTITLSSGVSRYVTASTEGFRFKNLQYVQFFNTTGSIASTDLADYTLYKKSGLNEAKCDSYIFDSSGALGIAPPPTTSGYKAIVVYNKYPATLSTNDLAVTPDLDENYQDLLIFGTMSIVAKSGISPDIDIANNAQADFDELLSMAKLETHRKKYKSRNKDRISYKEGWNDAVSNTFGCSSQEG
jgi:hypothetical protein